MTGVTNLIKFVTFGLQEEKPAPPFDEAGSSLKEDIDQINHDVEQ